MGTSTGTSAGHPISRPTLQALEIPLGARAHHSAQAMSEHGWGDSARDETTVLGLLTGALTSGMPSVLTGRDMTGPELSRQVMWGMQILAGKLILDLPRRDVPTAIRLENLRMGPSGDGTQHLAGCAVASWRDVYSDGVVRRGFQIPLAIPIADSIASAYEANVPAPGSVTPRDAVVESNMTASDEMQATHTDLETASMNTTDRDPSVLESVKALWRAKIRWAMLDQLDELFGPLFLGSPDEGSRNPPQNYITTWFRLDPKIQRLLRETAGRYTNFLSAHELHKVFNGDDVSFKVAPLDGWKQEIVDGISYRTRFCQLRASSDKGRPGTEEALRMLGSARRDFTLRLSEADLASLSAS